MAFGGLTSPVFVGRDEELAALTGALRDVAGGTSRCVLIAGEAGMGKSRLVAEAAARAERDGFRILRGQCVELGADGMALVPLVEALRTLARTTRPAELEALLGPARPELSRLLPELDAGSWQASRPAGATTGQLADQLPAGMSPAPAYRALAAAERVRMEGGPGLDAWSAAAESCRDPREPDLLSYALLRLAAEAFHAGQREAGVGALREAAALSARVGAAPLAEEAAALARRARVPLDGERPDAELAAEPADPLASFGLTSREREILSLIADGLSNGQIAKQLFISPKTASVHVSRILAKLGVSGRIEAAAVVHRLGLLRADDVQAAH